MSSFFKQRREFYIPKDSTKREYPEVGAVAYVSTTSKGQLEAMGFHGKAQKPDFNYLFKTPEQMEATITKWVDGLKSRAAYMVQRKVERKARVPGRDGYLTVSETAVFVRDILKESYPGVKFSVRSDSYAGGASIDILWTDGPTTKQVDDVVGFLQSAYFDGMIDYKGSRYHKLDGKPMHLGADYIHTRRDYTDELTQRCLDRVWEYWAWQGEPQKPTVEDWNQGRTWGIVTKGGSPGINTFQHYMNLECSKRTQIAKPMDSLTRKRFQFAGDDGYGEGTFGKLAD